MTRRATPVPLLDPQRAAPQDFEDEGAERIRELRDALAELQAFNASLSHDLRSPIGAIVNFASLLRDTQGERLDDDGRAFLERIESAAQRALARLDALIFLSRLGRRALSTEEVDVEAEVRLVFERLEQRRGTGPVELALQALPRCATDPELLRAVLEPLLDNAVKFSSAREKPRIEVGWLRCERAAGGAYFVRDNGVGFDAEHADQLLRVLESLHLPGLFGGAGLGLAIAARALRRLEGRLWAESAPGQGAAFYFTLSDDGEDDGSLGDAGSARRL